MIVEPRNSLRGELSVPGDKSISHRAIVIASLAQGTSEIEGFLLSEDCISTIECFRKMNIGIDILPNSKIKVHGKGLYGLQQPTSVLDTGRSGTSIRLLLGILSGQPFNSYVTRSVSAQRKPIGNIVKALQQMGANIERKNGGNIYPLEVSPANLQGYTCNISNKDSNIKSSVLVSSLYAQDTTIINEQSKSRDHTELMLEYFGANIKVENLAITCSPPDNLYAQKVIIPGDISLAAYFITAALIVPNSELIIKDVGINPTRTGILDVYKKMGAKIEILNEENINNEKVATLKVSSSELTGVVIDGDIIPTLLDEIPVIAVAATMAKGTTEIKNLSGYKVKTSGKVTRIVSELSKMGAKISETEDGLIIEGTHALKGTVIETYNDASITMSTAIAGLVAQGETMIRKSQILDIVYPDFLPVLNVL